MIEGASSTERSRSHYWRDPEKARARALRYHRAHAGVEAEKRKQRRRDPAKWAAAALPSVKSRAKRDSLLFNIDAEDIALPAVCPVFSTAFVLGVKGHPLSPSVDRLRPELGYVKGNVRVISRRANSMKQDCVDPAAFRRLADWLEEVIG